MGHWWLRILSLQDFQIVLPGAADRLIAANRRTALRLAQDPGSVALKLVKLREIFPNCNVLDIVEKRCALE